MMASGRQLSQRLRREPVLSYRWFDENYLGAAHGLAGIYYVLLCARRLGFLLSEEDLADVESSVNWLLDNCKLRGSDGNYPATLDEESSPSSSKRPRPNESDGYLCHFCHGAPGFVFLLCEAHRCLGHKSARYMEEALQLGALVANFGVLQKGVGLCHGTAGNGFALLALHRTFPEHSAAAAGGGPHNQHQVDVSGNKSAGRGRAGRASSSRPTSSSSSDIRPLTAFGPSRWLRAAGFFTMQIVEWDAVTTRFLQKSRGTTSTTVGWCDHPWSLYEGIAGAVVFLEAIVNEFRREQEMAFLEESKNKSWSTRDHDRTEKNAVSTSLHRNRFPLFEL
ncbi:unnamed protein product [Amoebophrya sp. A25]|nr:unnamed protein product [Amoebophrya sp. A25]|eukprot:GSA25T00018828001.1